MQPIAFLLVLVTANALPAAERFPAVFAAAAKDYMLAGEYIVDPNGKADAALSLGNLYGDHLKDDGKAMAWYDRTLVMASRHTWRAYRAAMAYARLAVRNNQAEEGLKRLSSVETEITKAKPSFPAQAMECRGDVYAAMGKKAEAEACYRKVVESEFAPVDLKKAARAKLDKLGEQG